VYTNDQDRFDTCEEAVNAVVKKVKRVWQVWKVSQQPLGPNFVPHSDAITFVRVFFHTVAI
jgi:hypothetical protein